MTPNELDKTLRQVMLRDLRFQCRTRGLSPAGGKEQLTERLRANMMETGNYCMKNELGHDLAGEGTAGTSSLDISSGYAQNNYMRPVGHQNVGNFITDRSSSRVLAPPGGKTTIFLGGYEAEPAAAYRSAAPSPRTHEASMPPRPPSALAGAGSGLPAGLPGQLPGALVSYEAVGEAGVNVAKAKVAGITPGGSSQIVFG